MILRNESGMKADNDESKKRKAGFDWKEIVNGGMEIFYETAGETTGTVISTLGSTHMRTKLKLLEQTDTMSSVSRLTDLLWHHPPGLLQKII